MSVSSTIAAVGVLAGLVVAGSAYAARHSVGLGSGVAASAEARARIERTLAVEERHAYRARLARWRPLKAPKISVPPPPAASAVPAPVAAPAPAPVAAAAPVAVAAAPPVTHTTTATTDDGGHDD